MSRSSLSSSGFSLIELIIYSSLVTVIVGVFLSSVNYVITTQDRDRERHAVVENERLIEERFDTLLYGVTSGQITPASGSAAILQVQRSCTDIQNIDLVASAMRIGKNSNGDCLLDATDTHTPLTNSHVQASGITFDRLTVNGQSAVRLRLTLTGRYQTQSVDKTVYLQ